MSGWLVVVGGSVGVVVVFVGLCLFGGFDCVCTSVCSSARPCVRSCVGVVSVGVGCGVCWLCVGL